MSKRYGRNQKRKAKEAYARLEQKQYELTNENARLSYLIGLCREWDKEIAQLLGKDSALRLESNVYATDRLPEQHRIVGFTPTTAFYDPNSSLSTENINVQNLRRIMITLRHDPDQYRTMLRLLMQDRKGDSAVYVDEEYMQRNGLTNRDVSAIAEMIAYQLVCHTNKAYGHGS